MVVSVPARALVLAMAGALAMAATTRSAVQGPSSRPVRVLIGSVPREIPLGQAGNWKLVDDRRRVIASGASSARWSVIRDGRRLRAIYADAPSSPWVDGALTIETPGDEVTWQQKTYRGVLVLVPTDSAIRVVNRVDVEEYLRGVVPLEIGARLTSDHAAAEAQAVAARSYTYTRMLGSGSRDFDLRASETDQVYGGVSAETFWGDLAVAATAGWVLSHRGQVVTAPYHSACGGSTALPSETWRGGQDGYLRAVSDTSLSTGRPWCDLAPRAQWERRIAASDLAAALARYGTLYTKVPTGAASSIRDVQIQGRTASGRARSVVFATGSGEVTLRTNDVRYVLRPVGGDLLPSTSFSLSTERGPDGALRTIVVRGRGNGHGVGMCQWGAIARARAGADFRAILKAYYPGAEITRAP
ncbi:MAG TPA: SpoIID/LytB domain-containing protein [Gemmatimonadaceae bacterium]